VSKAIVNVCRESVAVVSELRECGRGLVARSSSTHQRLVQKKFALDSPFIELFRSRGKGRQIKVSTVPSESHDQGVTQTSVSFKGSMTSTGRLQLRFKDDDDGTGKLLVSAKSGGFAGEGGAWFSCGTIEKFADAVGCFPISKNDVPILRGGFWKKDNSGELAQEHLAISVSPADNRGHLAVRVRIATELWEGSAPESQQAVRLEIITSYEPMVRFSRELKALVAGARDELVLEGDLLP
jgi:hypothetical protein